MASTTCCRARSSSIGIGEDPLPAANLAQPSTADLHPYEILTQLLYSSPIGSLKALMTSYSIVNRFMFFPPSGSYGFDADGDTAVLAMFAGAGARDVRRVYIPWTQSYDDGSGRTLGMPPLRMLYGGAAISCVTMSFGAPDAAATGASRNAMSKHRQAPTLTPAGEDRDDVRGSDHTPATPTVCQQEVDNPFLVQAMSPTASVPSAPHQLMAEVGPTQRRAAASLPGGPHDDAAPSLPPQDHSGTMDRVVLAFHGNATDCGGALVQTIGAMVRQLPGPCTVLLVEYPGYGIMEGEPSEALVKCAAERVVQFLFATSSRRFTPSRLTMIAHSMGTAVAVHLTKVITEAFAPLRLRCTTEAARSAYYVGALILSAPFSSVKCVVDDTVDLAYTHPDYKQRAEFESRILASCENRTVDAARVCASWYESFPLARVDPAEMLDVPPSTSSVDERGDSGGGGTGDTFPTTAELPLVYRLGRRLMLDRFRSHEVVFCLQRDHACFSTTTLVLVHGAKDDVIAPAHSLRLSMAAARGHQAAKAMQQRPPSVYMLIKGDCDHDTIFCPSVLADVIASFTALRGLSTMLAGDNPSVGQAPDGLCHAHRFYLTTSEARAAHAAHLRFDWKCLVIVVGVLVTAAMWVIVATALHGAYAQVHHSDGLHRVAVWGALESAALCCRAVGLCLEARCSLSIQSLESEHGPSSTSRLLYYVLRCVASTLLVAVGLLFGACCAFSATTCPSLHQHSPNSPPSPFNDRLGLEVPRWTMAIAAFLHGAQLLRLVLQHH